VTLGLLLSLVLNARLPEPELEDAPEPTIEFAWLYDDEAPTYKSRCFVDPQKYRLWVAVKDPPSELDTTGLVRSGRCVEDNQCWYIDGRTSMFGATVPTQPAKDCAEVAAAETPAQEGDSSDKEMAARLDPCVDPPDLRTAALCQAKQLAGDDTPEVLKNFRVKGKAKKRRALKDDVYIFVNGTGGSVGGKIPIIDENDAVHVYFTEPVKDVVTKKCSNPPPVRITGTGGFRDHGTSAQPIAEDAHVEECSADDGIELAWADQSGAAQTLALTVVPLYRLSVGVAVLYDFTVAPSFSSEVHEGTSVPIIASNQDRVGPSMVAFVAVRPAAVDTQSFVRRPSQWFAPAVGVSLRAPLDHVYLGALIEPFSGIGLIGGYHFLRKTTLAGNYEVGDAIASGAVPTKKDWSPRKQDWFVGLAFDGRVLAALISALGKK
jgi:hypothetical protein